MVDADAAALAAVEIAAREIGRLGAQALLTDPESLCLSRYAEICLRYDQHRLTWLARLDPAKLPDELLRRVLKETGAGRASDAR